MLNLNKYQFTGRIGNVVELKAVGSKNISMVRLRIAVSERYKSNDEWQEKTYWLSCVCWRSTAEYVAKYFEKGQAVYCEGKVVVDEYPDKDTGELKERFTIELSEVKALEKRRENQVAPGSGRTGTRGAAPQAAAPAAGIDSNLTNYMDDDDDDGLPF